MACHASPRGATTRQGSGHQEHAPPPSPATHLLQQHILQRSIHGQLPSGAAAPRPLPRGLLLLAIAARAAAVC